MMRNNINHDLGESRVYRLLVGKEREERKPYERRDQDDSYLSAIDLQLK